METIKIEKGIKRPNPRSGPCKYPWLEMKVGDSFLLKKGDGNSIRSAASLAGFRYKMKFSVSFTEEGYRVWRVK